MDVIRNNIRRSAAVSVIKKVLLLLLLLLMALDFLSDRYCSRSADVITYYVHSLIADSHRLIRLDSTVKLRRVWRCELVINVAVNLSAVYTALERRAHG